MQKHFVFLESPETPGVLFVMKPVHKSQSLEIYRSSLVLLEVMLLFKHKSIQKTFPCIAIVEKEICNRVWVPQNDTNANKVIYNWELYTLDGSYSFDDFRYIQNSCTTEPSAPYN